MCLQNRTNNSRNVAADNNGKRVNGGDKTAEEFLVRLCRRRSSQSRETPPPTRESAFGTTTSLEALAGWTERTDENHEWLPFRLRNLDHCRQPRQRKSRDMPWPAQQPSQKRNAKGSSGKTLTVLVSEEHNGGARQLYEVFL